MHLRQLTTMLWLVFSVATVALAQQSGASASFVTADTNTQGNWEGVYGADGSVLAGVTPQNAPSYATFQVQNGENYTWASNPSDPRALETGSGTTMAACWYNPGTFNFNVNFTDGNTHQFALYAVDWDGSGRADTIQIVDANTGNQLDLRTLSNFNSGTYLVWNISGRVIINVTSSGGTNAVVSGAFFGPVSKAAVATFVTEDTKTQRNWEGVYGADGTALAGVTPQNVPSYARFYAESEDNYTWDLAPSDPRALETGSGQGRIAACWYNFGTFNFDVNFTDGNAHQFALYAVDWDNSGRADTIQIVDVETGNQLDLRTLSNFSSGVYLLWSISGHVIINVTSTGGTNAVVSGVFFGNANDIAAAGTPLSVTTTSLSIGQQGNPYTAMLAATGGMAPYSWDISSGALPAGLTLSPSSGMISGTPTASGTFRFIVRVTDSTTPAPQAATKSLTIAVVPLSITTISLPEGQQGNAYSATLTASDGVAPYTWSISAGALPTGLILNSANGEISGILTGSGSSTFSVRAADSTSPIAQTDTASFTITIGSGTGYSLLLTWAASPSSEASGYNVYRSNVSGTGYAKINSTPISGLSYTDATVVNGQTYYYVTTAVDSSGDESAFSSEIQEVVP